MTNVSVTSRTCQSVCTIVFICDLAMQPHRNVTTMNHGSLEGVLYGQLSAHNLAECPMCRNLGAQQGSERSGMTDGMSAAEVEHVASTLGAPQGQRLHQNQTQYTRHFLGDTTLAGFSCSRLKGVTLLHSPSTDISFPTSVDRLLVRQKCGQVRRGSFKVEIRVFPHCAD